SVSMMLKPADPRRWRGINRNQQPGCRHAQCAPSAPWLAFPRRPAPAPGTGVPGRQKTSAQAPCGAPRRAGSASRRRHHEVVARDDFVAALAAEPRRDLARVRAGDLGEIGSAVAHEPARDLLTVGVDAAHAVADAEAALDAAYAGGQEAPPSLGDGAHRARI